LNRKGNIKFYTHKKRIKINKRKNIKTKLEKNFYLEPLVYSLRKNVHKRRRKKNEKKQNKLLDKKINEKTILMLGFDYKYQGNSKYLFDYLKHNYDSSKLKFEIGRAHV